MKQLALLIFSFCAFHSFAQNWQQIGPEGGYFKEFTFSPADSNIIYAGSDDGGGIWKSTDGGQTWALTTADFPNMTGWSISIDENNPNIVYGCDVYGRYGLLKSTDGGANWTQSVNGLSNQYERMVSGITLKTSDTLFISTGEGANTTPPRPGNGVFRSFDAGATWSPAGLQGETVLCISSSVFGTLFAGTESIGLQFSNDNGATWIPHPDVNPAAGIFEIQIEDSVIAVASNAGIYLSTNWGINFTNIGLAGDFNFDLYIQQLSPSVEILVSTFTGLQRYSSSTSTWTTINDPLLNNKLVIGIGAQGSKVILSTFSNSPIYISNDSGTNWQVANTSPLCTEINDLVVDPNDDQHLLTCLLGTYNIGGSFNDMCLRETTNGGTNWTLKGPTAHALCLSPNPQNFDNAFLGTFSQGLYRSDDSFDTFTQLISGNKLVGDIAISSEDTNVVIISEVDLDLFQTSIKRSTDRGDNFTTVSSLVANRVLFNQNDNDTVYAATTNGIHLSTDNGITWNSWVLSGNDVYSLGYFNNALYAGTGLGELYRIEGSSTINITGSWDTPSQLKSIYGSGTDLFVGLNGAEQDTTYSLNGSIWHSDDNGASWTNVTANMTSTNVYGNNVITSVNNDLLVATYGGGVFQAQNLLLSTNHAAPNLKTVSIYPNPTADVLTIELNEGQVRSYSLVDGSGKVVLSGKNLPQNNSIFKIDIRRVPVGTYLLSLGLSDDTIVSYPVCKLE
jgi:photosystem II stability/assembly factor-like uncharacterized protein